MHLSIAESMMRSMTRKRFPKWDLCICQLLGVWWNLWLEKDPLSEIYAFAWGCDEIYDWKESSHLYPPIFSYLNPNIRHVPLYKNSTFLKTHVKLHQIKQLPPVLQAFKHTKSKTPKKWYIARERTLLHTGERKQAQKKERKKNWHFKNIVNQMYWKKKKKKKLKS